MDPWQKESLNLKVGDTIIWQDEAIEVEGQPAVVTPGMTGEVLSLHDGFHLEPKSNPAQSYCAVRQWHEADG